jgi:hypothetical protein
VRYVDAVETYPAVILHAGTLSIYYEAAPPVLGAWETRVVPLTETGWRLSGPQTAVDEATFRAVLADLHGIYFYTEWRTGPDDTSLDNVRLTGTPVGVDDAAPAVALLRPCAPNPFNPGTTVRFTLPAAAGVELAIYGVDGRRVRTLEHGHLGAGEHSRYWDGRDDSGRTVPSGAYVCRLSAGLRVESTRLSLVK